MSVDINNGGTLVLIDCTFLNKEDVLTSKQVSFEWKQNSLFNMIYFLLEKVIRYEQLPVDCLRASKLVTLGYTYS